MKKAPAQSGSECAACHRKGKLGELPRCDGCRSVHYCNPECQRAHWETGGHRRRCRALAAAAAAATAATAATAAEEVVVHGYPIRRAIYAKFFTSAGDFVPIDVAGARAPDSVDLCTVCLAPLLKLAEHFCPKCAASTCRSCTAKIVRCPVCEYGTPRNCSVGSWTQKIESEATKRAIGAKLSALLEENPANDRTAFCAACCQDRLPDPGNAFAASIAGVHILIKRGDPGAALQIAADPDAALRLLWYHRFLADTDPRPCARDAYEAIIEASSHGLTVACWKVACRLYHPEERRSAGVPDVFEELTDMEAEGLCLCYLKYAATNGHDLAQQYLARWLRDCGDHIPSLFT